MPSFINEDFLLNTPSAKRLYHEYAEVMPIIDYHCHLSPKEIWENKPYRSITQLWLGGDHYKWRLMRCAGVPEKYITGDAGDYEKFERWAKTLSMAAGNPLFHWSHLELKRYFGYDGLLNASTAKEVYELCGAKLKEDAFLPRNLILRSNVRVICTTDDPVDSLEYHALLAKDASFPVTVLPAFRPDPALAIEKEGFSAYIRKLSAVSGVEIADMRSLMDALEARMDHFEAHGCRLSDQALFAPVYETEGDADDILRRRLKGEALSAGEMDRFRTVLLTALAKAYSRRGWAMQLHYGVQRNNNKVLFEKAGADIGCDTINNATPVAPLLDWMGSLRDELPRMIVYSLNPNDDTAIDGAMGCFQTGDGYMKMQHGSAWWFNDHIDGMRRQLKSLADTGYLAGFVGMLTDSRSFISYPRHEYFRRILCALVGGWIDEGLYAADEETLKTLIQNICYDNAKNYFAFEEKQL